MTKEYQISKAVTCSFRILWVTHPGL